MSYVMLPKSSHAIPNTQAERNVTEKNVDESLPRGNDAMHASLNCPRLLRMGDSTGNSYAQYLDPPDEPGAEMAKDARVWRTYVREADRWDKEMVQGRNNSLDVLLIFAAMFSAISTAFIIESLGDLKPDPTESSSQTLLLISQTLIAISNGHSVSLPSPSAGDPPTFIPSHTAVVVNLLWLLSLSRSVAVSLIAMLAKEWCYKFMSGRSGPMYEQARRRQERWNGIERWKMKQVLTYLPGLMHLALLLFATGLSIYLWNINIKVAAPVVVVTAGASLAYMATTLVPLLDGYCPYASPLTPLLLDIYSICMYSAHQIRVATFHSVQSPYLRSGGPKWLKSALKYVCDILELENQASKDPPTDTDIPMDVITSQMLSWMIVNCEDSRSVDMALQALAASTTELPFGPVLEAGVDKASSVRIQSQFEHWDRTPEHVRFTDRSLMPLTVIYSRLYSRLVTGGAYSDRRDRWDDHLSRERRPRLTYDGFDAVRINASILEYLMSRHGKPHNIAVAVVAALPLCHWESWRYQEYRYFSGTVPETSRPNVETFVLQIRQNAPAVLTSLLQRHLAREIPPLSTNLLKALAQASAHYLIGLCPRQELHESQRLLPVLLARLYLAQDRTATRLRQTIAVTLAASAFAICAYPGGNHSSQDTESREKRALRVFQYYHTNPPDKKRVNELLWFGFIGLLPLVDFTAFRKHADVTGVINAASGSLHPTGILAYTLPTLYSRNDHAAQIAARCLFLVSRASFTLEAESNMVSSCLNYLTGYSIQVHGNLYLPALVALCHARSTVLQDFCLAVLRAQQAPIYAENLLADIKEYQLLNLLYSFSLSGNHRTASVAALHFNLLVGVCALSPHGSYVAHRAVLEPLICREELSNLIPSYKDCRLPSLSDFCAATESEAPHHTFLSGVTEGIMQMVVDFFHADSRHIAPSGRPLLDHSDLMLNQTLQAIKHSYESLATNQKSTSITNTKTTANPCWLVRTEDQAALTAPQDEH